MQQKEPIPLSLDDIKQISVSTFNIIQSTVRVDKLLLEILHLFEWEEEIKPNCDFKIKIDLLFVVLDTATIKQDTTIGYKGIQFETKKLKSVLLDIATIRNQFAHEFVVISVDEMPLEAFNISIIEFFLNPEKGGKSNIFPSDDIRLKFNPQLLNRKNYITIGMGDIIGEDKSFFAYNYDKSQTKFKDYQELFKYFEILIQYATESLIAVKKIYSEKMK